VSASGSWAQQVDPQGRWQMVPADRLLADDVFAEGALVGWGGPRDGARAGVVAQPVHRRHPMTLELRVRVETVDGPFDFPGAALVRIETRPVDPNRLGSMRAVVERAGVPAEAAESVARGLLARGVPLGQVRQVLAAEAARDAGGR
jgi:hypothetical protein